MHRNVIPLQDTMLKSTSNYLNSYTCNKFVMEDNNSLNEKVP